MVCNTAVLGCSVTDLSGREPEKLAAQRPGRAALASVKSCQALVVRQRLCCEGDRHPLLL